ncbi:hypothetical protein [Vallitalea sp.]|jgi:hypothetical protein|uniref:hypothetical protein n=1 Tax=Vallitalea sp. TaxID=1882829 RepID=UPI0025FC5E7E|nr:hypothetical protein [Vallitalea sp.]MCT4686608.1 hypothetical protein [Vallitalea sp.]
MSIINGIKEILEILEGQTVESIEEFRQEWISGLNVDERFIGINVRIVNYVCDMAEEKATA